jgi:hypothetical protein
VRCPRASLTVKGVAAAEEVRTPVRWPLLQALELDKRQGWQVRFICPHQIEPKRGVRRLIRGTVSRWRARSLWLTPVQMGSGSEGVLMVDFTLTQARLNGDASAVNQQRE